VSILSFQKKQALSQNGWFRWLKEIVLSLAIVFLVIGSIQWLQRIAQQGGGGRLPVGSLAPAFTLKELDSAQTLSLNSLRGYPVILNFWAPWCSACVSELPEIAQLTRQASQKFHVITITQEVPSVVRPFLERRALSLRVLYDPTGLVSQKYKVDRIPTTVIVDSQGRVVHDFTGPPFSGVLLEHMAKLSQTTPKPSSLPNDP
jgi:cytochrome c biogenesis protein CcmG/thiol:disulfide interchange protein DsbE